MTVQKHTEADKREFAYVELLVRKYIIIKKLLMLFCWLKKSIKIIKVRLTRAITFYAPDSLLLCRLCCLPFHHIAEAFKPSSGCAALLSLAKCWQAFWHKYWQICQFNDIFIKIPWLCAITSAFNGAVCRAWLFNK